VNGADPVRGSGDHLALKQTGPQLNLLGGNAICGRHPTQHAQPDDHDDSQRSQPPHLSVTHGAPGHDQADESGDGLAQLPDGVNQQHPGAQPAPGRILFNARHAHVASPWL